MLSEYPHIKVIGEAANTVEAIPLIMKLKPDVVFLDIHMPGLSGFDLLYRMNVNFKVIFISSYDRYREKAKKHNAVDFLLKPINKEKLGKAVQKL
jgi:two-component system LytT family response regulator